MSPVSTVEPEEITYSGVTRIEDLVAQMPQVFAAQNATISNGASGTATVAPAPPRRGPHAGADQRPPHRAR